MARLPFGGRVFSLLYADKISEYSNRGALSDRNEINSEGKVTEMLHQ